MSNKQLNFTFSSCQQEGQWVRVDDSYTYAHLYAAPGKYRVQAITRTCYDAARPYNGIGSAILESELVTIRATP